MKISISDLLGQFASIVALNSKFQQIEDELNDKVLYRDNPGTEPNEMNNDLDMNNNPIINLPPASDPTSPLRLIDVEDIIAGEVTLHSTLLGLDGDDHPHYFMNGRNMSDGVVTDGASAEIPLDTALSLRKITLTNLSDLYEGDWSTYSRIEIHQFSDAVGAGGSSWTKTGTGGTPTTLGTLYTNGLNNDIVVDQAGNIWTMDESQVRTFEMYGAVGDGVADDASAIFAASSSGKSIEGTPGKTYLVGSTVTFDTAISGTTWNLNFATFVLDDEVNTHMFILPSGVSFFKMCNFEADGNGVNQTSATSAETSNFISYSGSNISDITYENYYVHDFGFNNRQPSNSTRASDYNHGGGFVQASSAETGIDRIHHRNGIHENLYTGCAYRSQGESIHFEDCFFRKLAYNSILTRLHTHVVVTGCFDEDTRGAECWGDHIKYTNNHVYNSHRHGVSGGVDWAFISGNSFVRDDVTLTQQVYAMEIGLSQECRVVSNYVLGWNGTGGIRITDAANGSDGAVIDGNIFDSCVTTDRLIGASNAQDFITISNNKVYDCYDDNDPLISINGESWIVTDNLIWFSPSAVLADILQPAVSGGSVGGVFSGNKIIFPVWKTGDSLRSICQISDFDIIKGNSLTGGYLGFNARLDGANISGNVFKHMFVALKNTGTGDGPDDQVHVTRTNSFINVEDPTDTGFDTSDSLAIARFGDSNSIPTVGTHKVGDRRFDPTASGGWRCTTTGTFGTYSEGLTATTDGTQTVTLSGATSELEPGMYITINSTAVRIHWIDGTEMIVSSNIAAGAGLAIAYTTPAWTTF